MTVLLWLHSLNDFLLTDHICLVHDTLTLIGSHQVFEKVVLIIRAHILQLISEFLENLIFRLFEFPY